MKYERDLPNNINLTLTPVVLDGVRGGVVVENYGASVYLKFGDGTKLQLWLPSSTQGVTRTATRIKLAANNNRLAVAVAYEERADSWSVLTKGVKVFAVDLNAAQPSLTDEMEVGDQSAMSEIFVSALNEIALLSLPNGNDKMPMQLTTKVAR